MVEQPAFFVGDGRYAMFEEVGHGEFGEVWRGRDNVQGMVVAVKLLGKDVKVGDALQETRLLTRLQEHDRVITIRNVSLIAPGPFIAMDYLSAGSVGKRLEMGVVTLVEAVSWIEDTLDGLAFVHSEGIVHRDIKPGNLLLDEGGRVVLSDFGIAEDTVIHLLSNPKIYWPHQAPETGTVGSSVASDTWAVGCTLYRLLTGRYRFESEGEAAAGVYQAPHHLNPQVPMHVTKVVAKALAVNPDERYQTAGAMLNDLLKSKVSYCWTRMSDVEAIEHWEAITPQSTFVLTVAELSKGGFEVKVTRDKGSGPRKCFAGTCKRKSEAMRVRRGLLLKLVASGGVV